MNFDDLVVRAALYHVQVRCCLVHAFVVRTV
jgi:hypothetical protein